LKGLVANIDRWKHCHDLQYMKEDRERCLPVGMDDYLSKPILPDQIKVAIERAAKAHSR
jgi:CheY-like chemotaxis protein